MSRKYIRSLQQETRRKRRLRPEVAQERGKYRQDKHRHEHDRKSRRHEQKERIRKRAFHRLPQCMRLREERRRLRKDMIQRAALLSRTNHADNTR